MPKRTVSHYRWLRREFRVEWKWPILGIEREVSDSLIYLCRQITAETPQLLVCPSGKKQPETLQYHYCPDDCRANPIKHGDHKYEE